MRSQFDRQLEELHLELMKMGALCEEAISAGVKALLEGDQAMAEKAIRRERDIDQREREIESLCMKLLLQQQPVARDLRTISSALKMISDMERIGDQASDIAEITRSIGPIPLHGQLHVEEMARSAVKMVTDSVESFVKRNLDMALGVMEYDDVVDGLFDQVKEELTALIRADASSAGTALDLLMIAKYLERIGDHAVNVAEWVLYSITGSRQPSGG
ncbi:MAG: phosphate signaling complex protein PhoU [Oscillospiraceae bacterium]|jgi:phosphate transport system protein|nr:phosphate signaling complex protein PhoU [Oscillospiraceae bacterium]